MKLCSACLLGINCRYDGKNKTNKKILKLSKQGKLIPVCPEQLGGLPTPRIPSEIQGLSGEYVLNGRCKVLNRNGEDVTEFFIKGANETLRIAKLFDIKEAIFKQKSPSCGCGKIHDGTFSDKLIDGNGVTTALLKKNGIKIKFLK
jgi:uncharacterized protein YbbK (DUF523 family)